MNGIPDRLLYTPTRFARTSLLHVQEVGELTAVSSHVSSRDHLGSFLCFVVLRGSGILRYEGVAYDLHAGDVAFVDCRKPYAHETGTDLWTLKWCHFQGPSMSAIYAKYRERGGRPVFRPQSANRIEAVLDDLRALVSSDDYIRDMRINEKLGTLLTFIMEESWNPPDSRLIKKQVELCDVRDWLNDHFTERITLDSLAARFFVNKYYLSRIFKESFGMTITDYVRYKRATEAKRLLRFTDLGIDEIAAEVGVHDANYFSRMFRKIEGMSPRDYRAKW
ncbi:AraC family transcriptional regulator [Bifidobacterium simiiventris]|uniref:AraC family transcriptional regulator n=1 Tax=Bifidobacterium simiiventris TaxID=2834434 RepID=UPI001C55B938|nr:AraC family transcriptional regulator [Bifidobacterium simiiventris]MBW3078690.1 helix-turn-helix transcriptional regulator [Bifidobacterium simiiventris]